MCMLFSFLRVARFPWLCELWSKFQVEVVGADAIRLDGRAAAGRDLTTLVA